MAARGGNMGPHGALDAAWRALASTFLHESPAHVFFNAVTLYVLGQATERIFARGGFALLAALGGASASFGSLWGRLHHAGGDHAGMSIGGSGLGFALGRALLAAADRMRPAPAVGRPRPLAAGV